MAVFSASLGETELDFDRGLTRMDGQDTPLSFSPIKPNRYVAVVRDLTYKTFRAKHGKNVSDEKDGLWSYVRLTPNVMLVNSNSTVINRQDYVLGVVDSTNRLMRPDGDITKSPIFGGEQGALFMLMAMGLVNQDAKTLTVSFDPDNIHNRVVVVTTSLAAYNVKNNDKMDYDAINKAFRGAAGGDWDFEELAGLTDALNVNEGDDWRVKNVVRGWWRVSPEEATAKGYVVDGNQVFLSQNDLDKYRESLVPVNPLAGKKTGTPKNGAGRL